MRRTLLVDAIRFSLPQTDPERFRPSSDDFFSGREGSSGTTEVADIFFSSAARLSASTASIESAAIPNRDEAIDRSRVRLRSTLAFRPSDATWSDTSLAATEDDAAR